MTARSIPEVMLSLVTWERELLAKRSPSSTNVAEVTVSTTGYSVRDWLSLNAALARFAVRLARFRINARPSSEAEERLEISRKYGIQFSGQTPASRLREVLLQSSYTRHEEFVPRPGDLVIDIGAQYGDYALLAALHYKANRVYSFEPLQHNFEILAQNIRINNARNVIAARVALTGRNGEMDISVRDDMAQAVPNLAARERVESRTLDSYSISNVSLVKIDTEGFEVEVLCGATNTIRESSPRIIIETHTLHSARLTRSILSRLGYYLIYTDSVGLSPTPGLDQTCTMFFRSRTS